MTTELFWLLLSALATALMWLPYVLNRIAIRGLMPAMKGMADEGTPHSAWADRARVGHANAVENLGVFAVVVLVAHLADVSNGTTALWAAIYFFTRIAHYVICLLGIPVARTLSFAASWLAIIVIGVSVLMA